MTLGGTSFFEWWADLIAWNMTVFLLGVPVLFVVFVVAYTCRPRTPPPKD